MANDHLNASLLELLDQALELAPAELAPWLAELARSAPDQAVQLRELLAVRSEPGFSGFMAGPGPAAGIAEVAGLAGRRVGAYRLDRELGSGGMGTVWLAHRVDGKFEAQVAIKFLQAALATRGGAARFAREGNLLARLSHPNIARLLDAGVDEGGQPFLVIEYVEGEPIDTYCDAHGLSVAERIELFLDVLAAVQHAHRKLILHRDLKPSNILVAADGRVRLLDFGIAKLMSDGEGAAATELTRAAGRVFTPAYAAPEQVRGEDATMATDVYAAGVLLFELLSGIHPLGQTSGGQLEQLRAVLERDATRLSTALSRSGDQETLTTTAQRRGTSPAQLQRALRGDLENILARALRKDPAARYATVEHFADDLRRYLAHEPVLARPDSFGYRAGKFVRRHRAGVIAAGLVALALAGGVAATVWQAVEATRARNLADANAREAEQRRQQAEFQAKLAVANHEFLSQIFGDTMGSGENERLRKQLDRARSMLQLRYGKEPLIHASLLMQLAGRYAEAGDDKREAEVMADFDQLAASSGEPTLLATSECIKAYDLIRSGELDAAAPHVQKGMAVAVATEDTDAGFECYRADAMLAASRGDRVHAVQRMEEWLARLEKLGRTETRVYFASLGSLAYIHDLMGDTVQTYLATKRSRELTERMGSGHTLTAYVDVDREAGKLLELGRLAEATALDAELEARAQADGEELTCQLAVAIAGRALRNGDTQRALPRFLRCLPGYERDGPAPYARGVTLDVAAAQALAGDASLARARFDRYRRMRGTGKPSPREAARVAYAELQIAIAGRAGVAQLGARTHALLDALDPSLPRDLVLPLRAAAADGALQAGDIALARDTAKALDAYAAEQRLDGKANAWNGAAALTLAECDLADGDKAGARQHLSAARAQLADSVATTNPWWIRAEKLVAQLPGG